MSTDVSVLGLRAFKVYAEIVSFFTKAGLVLSAVSVTFMALLVTTEVVARGFLGFSTLVADEFSAYLLACITFFGMSYCMEAKGFLQVDFILDMLSQKHRNVLKSALLFLALIYSILLDCYLIHYTFASYSREIVSTSLSQTPLYIPQLVMPIGMTLFVFELIKEWIYTLFNLLTADAPSNPKGGL